MLIGWLWAIGAGLGTRLPTKFWPIADECYTCFVLSTTKGMPATDELDPPKYFIRAAFTSSWLLSMRAISGHVFTTGLPIKFSDSREYMSCSSLCNYLIWLLFATISRKFGSCSSRFRDASLLFETLIDSNIVNCLISTGISESPIFDRSRCRSLSRLAYLIFSVMLVIIFKLFQVINFGVLGFWG